MKNFFTLAICFFLMVGTAQAQSFFRKHHKYQRKYMSSAITGAVSPKVHGPWADLQNTTPYDMGVDEARAGMTPKQIRKAERRQLKYMKDANKIAARDEARKYRAESKVLGHQLALKETPNRGFGR